MQQCPCCKGVMNWNQEEEIYDCVNDNCRISLPNLALERKKQEEAQALLQKQADVARQVC